MKQLSLGRATKGIAVVLFLTAAVLPVYSQEVQAPQRVPAAQDTSDPAAANNSQRNTEFSIEANSTVERKINDEVESAQTGANQATNQGYVFPNKRGRFNRYIKSLVGPFSLAESGVLAGIDQWQDHPDEWRQGASGYGKRYASRFGQNVIKQTVIYGLDTALELDTRFKRSQRKGFFPRLKDALAENITSRTRTGKRVISVPRLTGVYASKIISRETWYPSRYDFKDGLRSGTNSLLIGFGLNLVREFVISW